MIGPQVFLAHAITADTSLGALLPFCDLVDKAFCMEGWRVRRTQGVLSLQAGTQRGLVSQNVAGISNSNLLVVVASSGDLSSIWVEIGIAMAAGIPIAVLRQSGDHIPYLVKAGRGTETVDALPPIRIDDLVMTSVVGQPEATKRLFDFVRNLTDWWARVGWRRDLGQMELEDLFRGAREYLAEEAVTATRLDETRSWATARGSALRGETGDWLLTDGTTQWTVAADKFESTYEQVGPDSYKKCARVHAVRVREPLSVATLEGRADVNPGDWLLRNPTGEIWPVTAMHFRDRYGPAS